MNMLWRSKHKGNTIPQNAIDEQEKVNELLASIGPLTGRAKQFCTDDCLKRYLRARSWNVAKAKKMLEDTLKWRASYKPEEIQWDDVAVEGETGKIQRVDFIDSHERPVLLMIPAKENTASHDGQIKYLVYCMENAIVNLPPGKEQFVWTIDFTGWSLAKATPLKTARESAHVLQNHYPERLGLAIIYNPPRIFEYCWKMYMPFLDPITCENIRFTYAKERGSMYKPFIDPITFEKIRFTYAKDPESVKFLEELFDRTKLTTMFDKQYNHEEYVQRMRQDDIKKGALWNDTKNASQNGSNGNGEVPK